MFERIYNKIWFIVTRRKPTLSAEVFRHRTWLERQVQEAQYKQAKYQVYGIR